MRLHLIGVAITAGAKLGSPDKRTAEADQRFQHGSGIHRADANAERPSGMGFSATFFPRAIPALAEKRHRTWPLRKFRVSA